MSRCFPFPPPGYEKKARTDEVDLLKKVNILFLYSHHTLSLANIFFDTKWSFIVSCTMLNVHDKVHYLRETLN